MTSSWVFFRVVDHDQRDVLLDTDHIESIYPGDTDGSVDIYTRTGVHIEVLGSFADMASMLSAIDKRPRDTTPVSATPTA